MATVWFFSCNFVIIPLHSLTNFKVKGLKIPVFRSELDIILKDEHILLTQLKTCNMLIPTTPYKRTNQNIK